ncbi:MAG: hypothetical protein CEN90_73 [Parcubacteria group bacterium Licking1014_17]|nr:MAG: hypothetical protein CEN90_73 [Parcubacteria group bacterium Licking1014_17]
MINLCNPKLVLSPIQESPKTAGSGVFDGFRSNLRRSAADKVFMGVAGGFGEYFGVNSFIFRLFFILLAFTVNPVIPLVIYLAFTAFVPLKRGNFNFSLAEAGKGFLVERNIFGMALALAGAFILWSDILHFNWADRNLIIGALICVLGFYILFNKNNIVSYKERLALGLVIIGLGIFWYVRSHNLLPMRLEISWYQIWPLILSAVGISLIRGRNLPTVFFSGTALFAAALATVFIALGSMVITPDANISGAETKTIQREISASSAIADIHTSAGKLYLAGGTIDAARMDFDSGQIEINSNSRLENGVQKLLIDGRRNNTYGQGAAFLSVQLNSKIPAKIDLKTGGAQINLDFSNLNAEEINLTTGVSAVTVMFGEKAAVTNMKVKSGDSSIILIIPKIAGVRIHFGDTVLSPEAGNLIQVDDKTFETENFKTTYKKILLDFDTGASSVSIVKR